MNIDASRERQMVHVDLHVHTTYSGDSTITPKILVEQLHAHSSIKGVAITDHNILPISMERALKYSTKRLILIPGIQWRLHQNILERIAKRSTDPV